MKQTLFHLASQMAGIARYEFVLQWRRRGLVVLAGGLLAMLLLGSLLFSRASRQSQFSSGDGPRPRISQTTMSGSWLAVFLVITLFVPILAAETLPLDRQHGVRELLDSLPVRPGTFLAGRLLGLWAAVLAALGAVALVDALTGRLLHGPLGLGRYVAVWAGSLVPLALFLSAAGMLLAAPLPGRRAAGLAGIALGIFCFFGQAPSYNLDLAPLAAFWPPYYVGQLAALMSGLLEADYRAQVAALGIDVQYFNASPGRVVLPVPLICALGPLQLVAPWLLAWLWLRWKATR